MPIILLILAMGVLIGLSVTKISSLLKTKEWILTTALYLILFMIAITIGLEDSIVKNIENIRWTGFLLLVLAMSGGIITCRIFYNISVRKATNSTF